MWRSQRSPRITFESVECGNTGSATRGLRSLHNHRLSEAEIAQFEYLRRDGDRVSLWNSPKGNCRKCYNSGFRRE